MDTATSRPQQRSRTSNVWLTGSDVHKEFIKLCQEKGWETRAHLPRRGSREAKELDQLMDKGLGPGKPLTREQVNRKFTQWQRLLTTEPTECRLIDPSTIETTDELLCRLQKTECWVHFICKQKVDMFRSDSPVYSVVLSEGTWLCTCIDHLRSSLIDLVNDSIKRNTEKRVRGTEIDNQVQSTYVKAERLLRTKFSDEFVTQFCQQYRVATLLERSNKLSMGNVRERARAVAHEIAGQVVSLIVLAVKRGGQGDETMQNAVDGAIKVYQGLKAARQRYTDSIWDRNIYNVGGWLLNACIKVSKRRPKSLLGQALTKIVRCSDASHKVDQLKALGLPTGKTDAIASHFPRALHYPSQQFFDFILLMETVCEKLLVVRSLKVFGSKVAIELTAVLQNSLPIQVAIKRCLDTEESISVDQLQEASEYLTYTYMKMRATDFLRQIMSHRRSSLNPGTRPRLAAIAEGLHVSGKREEKSTTLQKNNKFTCFFCNGEGHTIRRCSKITIPPAEGEPHSMESRITLDGDHFTYVWHFCAICQQWSKHSTANHQTDNDGDGRGDCDGKGDGDNGSNIDDLVQNQDEESNTNLKDEAAHEEILEFDAVIEEATENHLQEEDCLQ